MTKNQYVILIDAQEWAEVKAGLANRGIAVRAFSLSNQIRLALKLEPVTRGTGGGGSKWDDEALIFLNEIRNASETSTNFEVTLYEPDWRTLKENFERTHPDTDWEKLTPSNRVRTLLGFAPKRRGRPRRPT
jgi:hypothetical protein